MDKEDKEIWLAMDRSIFGTNEPDLIRAKVPKLQEELRVQNSSLGNYLRSLRERRKWDIEQIAHEASVKPTQWALWEQDLQRPPWERIEILARIFSWGTAKQARLHQLYGESVARIEEVS